MGGDARDETTASGAPRVPDGAEEAGLDEVGVDLGPDEEAGGLLDGWDGRTVPGGEATAARGEGEVTGVIDPVGPAAVAVLARVAGGYARGADAERLAPLRGRPSAALKARLAEEPVDALPSAPAPGAAPAGAELADFLDADERTAELPGLPRPPGPPAREPPPPAPTEPRAEIGSGLLLGAVLLALAAGAAGAWLVLDGF